MTSEKRPLSSVNCYNLSVNVNENASPFFVLVDVSFDWHLHTMRVPVSSSRGGHTRSSSLFWVQKYIVEKWRETRANFIIPLTGRLVVLKLGTSTVQRCSRSFLFTLEQNHFIGSILTQTLKVGVTGHGCNHVDWLGLSGEIIQTTTKCNHKTQPSTTATSFLEWVQSKQIPDVPIM